jgi:hypothetical protein
MTAALSPELAIAYVRELSADVKAAVVLAANGAVLAGDTDLAPAAVAFAEALSDHTDAVVHTEAGIVFGAKTATHSLLVVASPLSLEGPTRLDTRAAVAALEPTKVTLPRPVDTPSTPLRQAANAANEAIKAH